MTRSLPPPRLRRLSDEEIELWLAVTSSVERRPGAALPERLSNVQPRENPAIEAKALPKSSPPRTAKPLLPPLAPLERKLRQSLSRGRQTADAAIDLHGFRQVEAYSALKHFLSGAQSEGARVVLVVTGKGSRGGDPFDLSGGSVGVLKRMVPLWLAQPEFRALVAGYEDAARPHGGTGALYVRLRRVRER